MKRFATERLFTAASLTLAGVLVAVLLGLPEAALFVTPWIVLLAVGLDKGDLDVEVEISVDRDRMFVGDELDMTMLVSASRPVAAKIVPPASQAFRRVTVGKRRRVRSTVDALSPTRAAELSAHFVAAEWGAHEMGRVAVEFTEPFGLVGRRGEWPVGTRVRVHPMPTQLSEILSPRTVRRVTGTHSSRESARGVEYADLREFTNGDSVREINWRVSARTGELWVSQRHPDRATDVVLLVDSFVESGHDVRAVFGLVIESAVALAESHLGATDRVGLVEFGGVVRWITPSTGRTQLHRLTDALLATGLYANAADKELPILPARVLPHRSFVVAFSPLLDERFIDAVYTAASRGHDVAVVECVAAAEPGADASQARTEVSNLAQQIREAERTMLRDRLADKGIAVVQWDGSVHIDVALAELVRRRRGALRGRGR